MGQQLLGEFANKNVIPTSHVLIVQYN